MSKTTIPQTLSDREFAGLTARFEEHAARLAAAPSRGPVPPSTPPAAQLPESLPLCAGGGR